MVDFLSGLGAVAGGFSDSGFFQQMKQNQQDANVGQALYGLSGASVPQQQQSPLGGVLGGIGSGISSLFGGGQQGGGQQQQQAPKFTPSPQPAMISAPQQQPMPQPPPVQQQPIPQPSPVQQQPMLQQPMLQQQQLLQPSPVQASAATPTPAMPQQPAGPMIANPGGGITPQQAPQIGGPPAPSSAQGTAALLQQQQPQRPPQQQQQQPQQQPMPQMQGQINDPISLIARLTRTPGMTPLKLGQLVRSPGFTNLLNQEGLAQYRAIMGGLHADASERGWAGLDERSRQFDIRTKEYYDNQARMERNTAALSAWKGQNQEAQTKLKALQTERMQATATYHAIMANPNAEDDERKKAQTEFDAKMADIAKRENEVHFPDMPKMEEGAAPDGGGGQDTITAPDGTRWHYKGGGDWEDKKNWEQVSDRSESMSQMVAQAQQAGFDSRTAPIIAAVAMAESGGRTGAVNPDDPGGSYGLTQINQGAHGPIARSARYNPQRAFQLAYWISKGGRDFSPWSTYKSGAYRRYLADDI